MRRCGEVHWDLSDAIGPNAATYAPQLWAVAYELGKETRSTSIDSRFLCAPGSSKWDTANSAGDLESSEYPASRPLSHTCTQRERAEGCQSKGMGLGSPIERTARTATMWQGLCASVSVHACARCPLTSGRVLYPFSRPLRHTAPTGAKHAGDL